MCQHLFKTVAGLNGVGGIHAHGGKAWAMLA
jgi:hypothetical protein